MVFYVKEAQLKARSRGLISTAPTHIHFDLFQELAAGSLQRDASSRGMRIKRQTNISSHDMFSPLGQGLEKAQRQPATPEAKFRVNGATPPRGLGKQEPLRRARGVDLAVYLEGREQPKVKISCSLVLLNFAKNVPVRWEKLTHKVWVSSVSGAEHNSFSSCSDVTIKGLGVCEGRTGSKSHEDYGHQRRGVEMGGPVFPQSLLPGWRDAPVPAFGRQGRTRVRKEGGPFHGRSERSRHPGFREREHWDAKGASECPAARQEKEEKEGKMASSPKKQSCLTSVLGLGAPRNGTSSPHALPPLPGLTGLSFSNSMAVRRAAQQYGLREGGENEDWTLYWTDYSVSLERVMEMKSYQKINHFPGMSEICRKDLLARNMSRMLKMFPKDFHFFPRTWCLPADWGDLQNYSRSRKNKTYICKPDSGCQGRGIFITRTVKEIKPEEDMICQLYISKPFIIDGFKFDLRIYVLMTSCDPLRIFAYNEGLARFATTSYSHPCTDNLEDICMHLTNYSINKHSSNFVRDAHSGSKRKLSTFNMYMESHGYNVEGMWRDIEDVIIKTIISAHPTIKHNYQTCFPNHTLNSACFEILGFDILLDCKLKPWLLEVNHSPSFSTDSRLDKEVKDSLLYDTLVLINLGSCDKKKVLERERQRGRFLQQCRSRETRIEEVKGFQAMRLKKTEKYEKQNCGGFRLIYPSPNSEKYEKFFQDNSSLFQNTVASRAREVCARQLIQELRLKQEKKSFQTKEKKVEMQGETSGEPARGKRGRSWRQKQQQKCKAATTYASKQVNPEGRGARMPSILPRLGPIRGGGPLTLVSFMPDLLLSVRDAKKNETDSSLDQEAPKKEAGPTPPKPTSARHHIFVPVLRDSSLVSCPRRELSKPISGIKEAKFASTMNIFPGTVPLTSVETSPESTTQVSDSPESLPSVTMTTSSECSSPEMDRVVSFKCKQHQIPQHLIQEKISNISLPTKSQSLLESLNPRWTLLKNDTKKQHLMSELFTKIQLREKLSLFPARYNPKLVLSNQSSECQCMRPNQLSLYQLGAFSMKKTGRETIWKKGAMADSDSRASTSFRPGNPSGRWPLPGIRLSPAAKIDDVNDFAFPENPSLTQEAYFHGQTSDNKRQPDVPSLLLLQSSHSQDVSLHDLLVVATPARLDPRPGRSHPGAMRDPCIQDKQAYSHCLISGQKGCEKT
ncbi:hypothetical protein HPG69_003002 [Diceros bicornis minor]|uniref:Tubulin polyglutamylase TTLL6 n=1 Tax=Diceros bicornis minor TaxID=77932 RepID=A0A7J7EJH2_DICBM|nr:hypothetical protein HPG69_003002 [Diceros bicornis minor]